MLRFHPFSAPSMILGCLVASSVFAAPVGTSSGEKSVLKCTPTTFTKCKADKNGRQYDCQTFKGEKCEVVSGPGSKKAKQ